MSDETTTVTLDDGTKVEMKVGETRTVGKHTVLMPEPAEALLEVVGRDDPRLKGHEDELQSLDEEGA